MATSPIAMMLQRAVASRLAGGGAPQPGGIPGPPGGGGGMGGPNPDAIGQAVGQQYSDLQGADPGKLIADLTRIKQELAAMFPTAVLRIGDMGKGISQAVTGINAALKAGQKAKETLATVHPPLGMSAANPQPMGEGGGTTPQAPGGSGLGAF